MEIKCSCAIESSDSSDQLIVLDLLREHWGSEKIVSKGKVVDASTLPRIVARNERGEIVGLATYLITPENGGCELVTLDAFVESSGIGTKLINLVEDQVKKNNCKRVWLITTNDNPEAAIFYVKRGYRLIDVRLNALDESRKLKPEIPKIGKYGIALNDEWEFEKIVD